MPPNQSLPMTTVRAGSEPPPTPGAGWSEALETRKFFISRVSRLNAVLKRRAAIYAKQTFDFSMVEWRIITLLPTIQPVSIKELAAAALTDGPHASRTVAELEARGYISRQRSELDSRAILVSLTAKGEAMSREMCQASLARNEQLLDGRTERQIDALNAEMDLLIERAESLLEADLIRLRSASGPSGAKDRPAGPRK